MPSPPSLRLSQNVAGLELSPTIAIQQRCTELIRQGRQVRRLGLGQSPFPVPEPLVLALQQHAREKDYLPTCGLPALREAVAGYLSRSRGLICQAADVLIGPGSKELLFLLQVAFDGEVLIPSPSWVSYAPQAQILGRRVRWLHTRPEQGWKLQAEDLERACDGPASRLLVLNYPSNPTGATYSPGELQELAEVARRHRVVVLSDEIYGELQFDGGHTSIARWFPEGTIVSTGLSKWCGAGGWRLGAFVFPSELQALQQAMAAVASESYTATCTPIQHAAVRAFEPSPEIAAYVRDCRRILEALAARCVRRLREAGAQVQEPAGAFYLFPTFEEARQRLARRGCRTAEQVTSRLLEDTGVACLPGSVFGRAPEELSFRLSLVDFDGKAALTAVTAQGQVDASMLLRCCRPVLEGVEALGEWMSASS